ncbi:hypothetical protein BD289DRAFT_492698 [Coniella lustricola]|uniref:Uncharacterized protein n=1 Tax=Coniella lustricola TaxID=2025994 RepID=A0A2T3AGS8_9PEZI|nr:hypothetical protein BD289DRAFT_492698 [Coniella lustricola]
MGYTSLTHLPFLPLLSLPLPLPLPQPQPQPATSKSKVTHFVVPATIQGTGPASSDEVQGCASNPKLTLNLAPNHTLTPHTNPPDTIHKSHSVSEAVKPALSLSILFPLTGSAQLQNVLFHKVVQHLKFMIAQDQSPAGTSTAAIHQKPLCPPPPSSFAPESRQIKRYSPHWPFLDDNANAYKIRGSYNRTPTPESQCRRPSNSTPRSNPDLGTYVVSDVDSSPDSDPNPYPDADAVSGLESGSPSPSPQDKAKETRIHGYVIARRQVVIRKTLPLPEHPQSAVAQWAAADSRMDPSLPSGIGDGRDGLRKSGSKTWTRE